MASIDDMNSTNTIKLSTTVIPNANLRTNTKPNMRILHVFTDGSAIKNTQDAPGGGAIFIVNNKLVVSCSAYGTNNYHELNAIRYALRCVNQNYTLFKPLFDDTIIMYSDSNYSIKILTGVNKAKVNLDVINKCKYYLTQLATKGIKVEFKHVAAHTKKTDFMSICNSIVDRCANTAAKELVKTKQPKIWTRQELLPNELQIIDKYVTA